MSSSPVGTRARSAAQLLQAAHEQSINGHGSSSTSSTTNGTHSDFPSLPGSSSPLANIITVDPFPSSSLLPSEPTPSTLSLQPKKEEVDISDESAFPSLGPAAGKGKSSSTSTSTWGGGGVSAAARLLASNNGDTPTSSRGSSPAPSANKLVHTTSLQLPTSSLQFHSAPQPKATQRFSNAKESEPQTLGEVMQSTMKNFAGVTVEASSNMSGITTVLIKAKAGGVGKHAVGAEQLAERVKRELLARLERRIQEDILVPNGLRAFIIGAKGRTLKQITDSTGCAIQIPPSTGSLTEDPDTLIPISLSGPASSVNHARAQIQALVAQRAAKASVSIHIDPLYLGLLKNRIEEKQLGAVEEVIVDVPEVKSGTSFGGVDVLEFEDVVGSAGKKNENVGKIVVTGERDVVNSVVEQIQAELTDLERTSKTVTISVSRTQHRLLAGPNAASILAESGCSIELPSPESGKEEVTIRGPQDRLVGALSLVMAAASSAPLEVLDLSTAHRGSHDPRVYASQILCYLQTRRLLRPISTTNDVKIVIPTLPLPATGPLLIELIGPSYSQVGEAEAKKALAEARGEIVKIVRASPPSRFENVEIDSLIHKDVKGKKDANLKKVEADWGVEVVFPKEGVDDSHVLIVYKGEENAEEKLEGAKNDLLQYAKEAAAITTTTIQVPTALHQHVQGEGGTTLNAVLGAEKKANVTFGNDEVTVRGSKEEVARVVKAVEKIVEDAKKDEIVNSYVLEFEVDTALVRHVVGKSGAGVNKLREDLGVRVDFEVLPSATPASTASKKGTAAAPATRSRVTIKGRKENAEEAKKRILGVTTKIADEVTLSIALPSSLERGALIGKQGGNLKRLESNYNVRINFPKNADEGDQVIIRGDPKGATEARKELVSLIEFYKEHGVVVTFSVSTASVPRILGKGGVNINQIKDDHTVTIDIPDKTDDLSVIVTLKGTKSATQAAKAAILAIAKKVDGESKLMLEIPKEFHTTLIGPGGTAIRDLIVDAGGPSDSRASGLTVRFPRQGEPSDTVTITAPTAVATKIKAALEKEVAALQSRVVWGVQVHQSHHRTVIGKGASALQELQKKHGIKIIMPGWNEWAATGEVANAEEVKDVAPSDLVKLSGPRDAVIAAAAELKTTGPSEAASKHTVQVPRKLHAKVAQGGRFFRSLPNGTRVTHGGVKPPASNLQAPKKPAAVNGSAEPPRIDDDEVAPDTQVQFQLVDLYEGVEEDDGEIPWVVESRSREDADKVLAEIERSLAQAKAATHIGWVTLPNGVMPRIVGRGGSGLDKLRVSGVEVEVVGKRDSNQLTLIGTPAAIEEARSAIVALAAPRPPRQFRDRDDQYRRDDY